MRIVCQSCRTEQTLGPGAVAARCCPNPRPVRASGKAPAPAADSSPTQPAAPRTHYRSKTEAAYAAHLEMEKRAGLIGDWSYETVKFRLKGGYWYCPDFPTTLPDGRVEYREVKGAKGKGAAARPFSREVGAMKVRMAAEEHSAHRFVIVWPLGGGAWGREEQ